MKRFWIFSVTVCLLCCMVSCGEVTTADLIENACEAYECHDMESAQSQVRELVDGDSLTSYSCRDLCQLSILLMKLGEQGYEENVAPAVRCYTRSFEVNADSATQYYSGLSAEDASFVTILSALSVALEPGQDERLNELEMSETEFDAVLDSLKSMGEDCNG